MILPDPLQDRAGNRLVDASRREDFGHMTFALEPQHVRAMTDSILGFRTFKLAKIVMNGFDCRRHSSGGPRIEFGPSEGQGGSSRLDSVGCGKCRRIRCAYRGPASTGSASAAALSGRSR